MLSLNLRCCLSVTCHLLEHWYLTQMRREKYNWESSVNNCVCHFCNNTLSHLCVSYRNAWSILLVSQIPQGQLHIAQVPQGEEVQITQDSEASFIQCMFERSRKHLTFLPKTLLLLNNISTLSLNFVSSMAYLIHEWAAGGKYS